MAGLRELIAPYAGKIDYGNLRAQASEWEATDGSKVTNIAVVYETPGGSTDQINVSFDHHRLRIHVLDERGEERETPHPEEALACIRPVIVAIPVKRAAHLRQEIQRQMDAGASTAGVVGHLNRLLNSELRGGTITHLEMRDAMTFAVQYAKGRQPPPQ
jgi:hypothetical protein